MTDQPNDGTIENVNELKLDDEQIAPAGEDHPDNSNEEEPKIPVEADVSGDPEDQTDVEIPEEYYQEADTTSPDENEGE